MVTACFVVKTAGEYVRKGLCFQVEGQEEVFERGGCPVLCRRPDETIGNLTGVKLLGGCELFRSERKRQCLRGDRGGQHKLERTYQGLDEVRALEV